MDIQFKSLPADLAQTLQTLAKQVSKYQIPMFLMLPIAQDPYYMNNTDETLPQFTEANRVFIEQLLRIQYFYIAESMNFEQMVDDMKQMKSFDPHYPNSARKFLNEAGLAYDTINKLIDYSNIKDKVDYTFIDRLNERKNPEQDVF